MAGVINAVNKANKLRGRTFEVHTGKNEEINSLHLQRWSHTRHTHFVPRSPLIMTKTVTIQFNIAIFHLSLKLKQAVFATFLPKMSLWIFAAIYIIYRIVPVLGIDAIDQYTHMSFFQNVWFNYNSTLLIRIHIYSQIQKNGKA